MKVDLSRPLRHSCCCWHDDYCPGCTLHSSRAETQSPPCDVHRAAIESIATNCCCHHGASVSGEWPEFQCYRCPIHTEPIMATPDDMCRRHKRESKEQT